MMLSTKKVKKIVLGGILGLAVIFLLTSLITHKVYAEEIIKRNIISYLDNKEVNYSSIDIDNQVLSIKLLSNGENRCTIDDVKAVQAVYEAVHGQTVSEKIEDVSIEVYDINNKLIYDVYENDVFSLVENAELLVKQSVVSEQDVTSEDILSNVKNIVTRYSYYIQNVNVEKAEEITGRKLELILCESGNSANPMGDTTFIYESLEAYSLSTGAITQCEITVFDSENECVVYMAGDFQYGNAVAWVSPKIESEFIAHEGPEDE